MIYHEFHNISQWSLSLPGTAMIYHEVPQYIIAVLLPGVIMI